jgi:hypothetical protein
MHGVIRASTVRLSVENLFRQVRFLGGRAQG